MVVNVRGSGSLKASLSKDAFRSPIERVYSVLVVRLLAKPMIRLSLTQFLVILFSSAPITLTELAITAFASSSAS